MTRRDIILASGSSATLSAKNRYCWRNEIYYKEIQNQKFLMIN